MDWRGPEHDLYRVLRCTAGEIMVRSRFAPRPQYARETTFLRQAPDGLHFAAHGLPFFLSCDRPWQIAHGEATFQTMLRAGDQIRCVLSSDVAIPVSAVQEAIEATRNFWQGWIRCGTYAGRWGTAVRRSAITLKLLTYAPNGAIVAAPTTSLPEWIGGVRNWDYRYTWLRDASFTLSALYLLGSDAEARAFFRWLGERALQYGTPLQIMYGVGGEAALEESELTHLEGYRGSRPVRIGNGAYNQRQLDVYGGVIDAAYLYEQHGDLLTPEQWAALRAEIDYVCAHWTEPDHGIWEICGPNQHHTFSKLMCWLALDRGIQIADIEGWAYDRPRWSTTREAIRASILQHGWNEQIGAFTMTYGATGLDASLLVIPLIGFLPGDDPRVHATIARIDEQLGAGALVYRYRTDDHLPGDEGAFLLCSFWMVDALAMIGQVDEAVRRFETLLSYASQHGLLSEEVDPATGMALGNYPQAFSHIGLINSAWRLTKALREGDRPAPEAG